MIEACAVNPACVSAFSALTGATYLAIKNAMEARSKVLGHDFTSSEQGGPSILSTPIPDPLPRDEGFTIPPLEYDTLAVAADALGETVVGLIRKADGRFQQAFGKGYDQFKDNTAKLLTAIDQVAPEFVQDGAVMLAGYGLAKGAGAAAGMGCGA